MKIDSRPTQFKPADPPKAQAAPPPPPPPKPAAAASSAPTDRYASAQRANTVRQQQALGNPDASSLRTERLGDGRSNCLEDAMALADTDDSIVLLADPQDGVGHALVQREDGSVIDPNQPDLRYQSVGQWQVTHPRYTDPRAVPASDMMEVLSTPPGPQRDALINGMGLGDVARRMVADEIAPDHPRQRHRGHQRRSHLHPANEDREPGGRVRARQHQGQAVRRGRSARPKSPSPGTPPSRVRMEPMRPPSPTRCRQACRPRAS